MTWKRKPISPGQSVFYGILIAFIQLVILDCIGFDFNREQEAWQHFCMKLLLGGMGVYVLMSCYILARRTPTRGDLWFIRFGVGLPLFLELFGMVLSELSSHGR